MSLTAHPLAARAGDWIAGRKGVEHGDVLLDRRRVYILPTRAGLVFAAAMIVLLVGSINYLLQLGFLLTFLVTSMAIVGMHQTHRNLARLVLRGHHVDDIFAGDVAAFQIAVANPTDEARYALNFAFVLPRRRRRKRFAARERPMPGTFVDVPAQGSTIASIGLPTRRRGSRPCPRIRIETRFPFGLWRAWAYYTAPLTAVAYPAPEEDAPPLPVDTGATGEGQGTVPGGEEFAGIRPYRPGDPQKMIAWRLAARSDTLAIRLFESTAGADLLLDFFALPGNLSLEQKLSRLTRWVLVADAAQLRYGLRLPSGTVAVGSGAGHRRRCLTALALAPG